jgi:murein DD-endopeptidase MepM/ murein hydrolase activator NlpD
MTHTAIKTVLRIGVACVALAAALPLFAAEPRLSLPDHLQQGQLVVGHAPPNVKIEYEAHRCRVGKDGVFVFGIEHDAPAKITLHVRYSNGKTETVSLPVEKRQYHIERLEGLPQQTVTPNPEIAARISREQKRVVEARLRDDEREDFLAGFKLPVEGARISGVYGSQRIDNGTPMTPHYGLDMAVPTGTVVHAPAAGVVTFAAPDLYLTGGTVLLDHGFGLTSSFLHMSKLDVKVGDRIRVGQQLGLSGATGRATGPHVHWGFNWFEMRLDPELLPKPAAAATP